MININRMIRGVAALAEQANRAFGISGGGEKNFLEQVRRQRLRARTAQQQAVRFYDFHGLQIDVFVSAGGVINVFLAMRKRRRIENDEIELLRGVAQILKKIGCNKIFLHHRKIIECEIFFRHSHGSRGRIHRYDTRRAALLGINRKRAGIAKAIQQFPPRAHSRDPRAVLTLIEKKAGLLAFVNVDFKKQIVLTNLQRRRRLIAGENLRYWLQAVFIQRRSGAAFIDALRLNDILQRGDNLTSKIRHAERADLHDQIVGILVNDQSGQAIAFGIDDAKSVGGF
ncbi:MAG: hypothetical protein ALAOOOJD_04429 [bacterium]|nr:hypothetical protein [bacterium]